MSDNRGAGEAVGPSLTAPRQRFSIISLFTNSSNRGSRKKKQRNSKKAAQTSKDVDLLGTVSHTPTTHVDSKAAGARLSAVSSTPSSKLRIDTESGAELRECPLCCDELPVSSYPEMILECAHRSCSDCMQQYLKIEIGESRIDISCPECSERLHPADIQKLINSELHMSKYEEFMVRRVLVKDPDTRWCPAPDCGYAVIAHGCAGCPELKCQRPGCDTLFCYHCKQQWHANKTCDAARQERLPGILGLSMSDIRAISHTDEYKSCPRCKTMINKMDDGSCNHMTCSICGAQFCWLCLQEASDLHYLSPSGCTFWGKKPWSKKKKILWQLGTLIGAPVGIALIAGLSVPVLIFGLPIWAARKLYQRFKRHNKHKRNIIVAFGTIAALIASPILAGVTIAIGVPVMLAYVYGVVPYSLCRGGTCGVKSDGGTFSFDFGRGNSDTDPSGRTNDGGAFIVTNPSIGPSIGENSLTAAGFALSASGIQMDRVGLADDQSDTKSASMKNMVGTSITGNSITGSIYEPDSSNQKLEIRADVSCRPSLKRERKNSVDSQTFSQADTRSLTNSDNKSHVSFTVDNASVRALAGSICTQRDKDGLSVVQPQDLASQDVRSRSCMRGDHGSPVSNRSVSFAAHDEVGRLSKKQKKRRDKKLEKGERVSVERLSLQSDTVSNSSYDLIPINKRCTEYKPRTDRHPDSATTTQELDLALNLAPPLTEVDVDKPHCSSVNVKKTVPHSAGVLPSAHTDAKVLCNILEDKGLDNCKESSFPV